LNTLQSESVVRDPVKYTARAAHGCQVVGLVKMDGLAYLDGRLEVGYQKMDELCQVFI
jgi:hypothetical protein